jgi:predicted dienelactone hydrolase
MRLPAPLAALAAIAACRDEPPPPDDPAPVPLADLAAPGPWSAGTIEREITGSDGEPLTIQLWYPTESDGAPVLYDGLVEGAAIVDAEPACADARPFLAFSHGSGGMRYQSPFFTEHLASHGWVVVAPDHRGNTFVDFAPDFVELVVRRPVDVVDAVDAALAEPFVAGCLDEAGEHAIAGHSFGGYTSLVAGGARINDPGGGTATYADPRVTSLVAMAPWDGAGTITDGTGEVAIPALILTGADDETTPLGMVRGLWEPLPGPDRWFGVMSGVGHYNFSPVACLLFTGDGCGPDALDPERFATLVNGASLAFLEHVRGTEGAIDQLPLDAPEIGWER